MGIGLALLLWAYALSALAVAVALVVFIVAHSSGGPARAKRVFLWLMVAVPLAVAYAVTALLAYTAWCGAVRGLDARLGSGWWGVPLGHGYSLSFRDANRAYVAARGVTADVAIIVGITEIGTSGDQVYGIVRQTEGFILNTRTAEVRRVERTAMPEALSDMGIPRSAPLDSVHDFYRQRRWGWQDLGAVIVLGVPPLLVMAKTLRIAWRGP